MPGASATGCAQAQPEESLAAEGVLGCAETAAWGQVTAVTPAAEGLRVVLRAERWVVPDKGAETVEFIADDPSRETGAPAWTTGDRGLLVLLPSSPPRLYSEDTSRGKEVEKAWRDDGARRMTECPA